MKKFNVSKECNACGLCTAVTDLLIEDEKGFAKPDPGKFISAEFLKKAEEIAAQCPQQAISITDEELKSMSELAEELEKRLKSFAKAEKPSWDVLHFDSNKYKAKKSDFTYFSRYDYTGGDSFFSSENKAASALVNHYYNQIDSVIMKILSKYKNDKLAPYWSKHAGYYDEFNKKFSEVLTEIAGKAAAASGNRIKLPKDFTSFNVYPSDDDNDYLYDSMRSFDTRNLSRVKNGNNIRYASELYVYVDVDKIDWYVGEGIFGNSKFTKKYDIVGSSVEDVAEQIISDINFAVSMKDIDEQASNDLEFAFEKYNRNIQRVIVEKINDFRNALSLKLINYDDNDVLGNVMINTTNRLKETFHSESQEQNFSNTDNHYSKIINYILEKLWERNGIDLTTDRSAMEKLQQAVDKAEHEYMTGAFEVVIDFMNITGDNIKLNISRDKFFELNDINSIMGGIIGTLKCITGNTNPRT